MKRILTIALTLLFTTTAAFGDSFVVQNVTVLPMTGKDSLANRYVVVEDGRITAITKKAGYEHLPRELLDRISETERRVIWKQMRIRIR